MSVKVVEKETGKGTTGKYAVIKRGQVSLYTGIMSDRKAVGEVVASDLSSLLTR